MSTEEVPEFITPKTIDQMSDEEYEEVLKGIRERRMVLITMHTQAVTIKNKAKGEKLQVKAARICGYIEKEVAKIEKIDETIQLRRNQIRALQMEMLELEDTE